MRDERRSFALPGPRVCRPGEPLEDRVCWRRGHPAQLWCATLLRALDRVNDLPSRGAFRVNARSTSAREIVRGEPKRPGSTMRVWQRSRVATSPPATTLNPKVEGSNPSRPISQCRLPAPGSRRGASRRMPVAGRRATVPRSAPAIDDSDSVALLEQHGRRHQAQPQTRGVAGSERLGRGPRVRVEAARPVRGRAAASWRLSGSPNQRQPFATYGVPALSSLPAGGCGDAATRRAD